MSEVFSQGQDPVWASISIAKFSHNTCPYGTRTFTWTHVGERNDLDLVFRSVRVVDDQGNFTERLFLKITAGAELLESQDLGALVKSEKEYDPLSGVEHPVQVVVKCPFLAMRYPKNTNTVRRIQLKFRSELDFNRALEILKDLGLPISDSLPGTQSKPRPTPSPAPSVASTSTLSTSTLPLLPRPASTTQLFTPSFSRSLDTPSYSPPESEFKVPPRPENSNMEVQRPFSSLPFQTSSVTPPLSASSTAVAGNPSLFLSLIEKETQRLSHPILHSSNLDDPNSHLKYSSILDSNMKSQLARISEGVETSSRTLPAPPFFSTRYNSTNPEGFLSSVSTSDDPFSQNDNSTSNPTRPWSTPGDPVHLQDLLIPPRRELPFPKPREKARSISVTDLPPLPKPTPVNKVDGSVTPAREKSMEKEPTPTHKPAKKRVAQRKPSTVKNAQEKAPTKEASSQAKTSTSVIAINQATILEQPPPQNDEPSPLAAKSAATSRPSSATSKLQTKATTARKRSTAPARPSSASKRSKMVDQCTQTDMLSDRDHIVLRRSTSASNVLDLVDNVPIPDSPQEDYLNTLDYFVSKYKARPAPKELYDTPGYAEADEEERGVLINDFICENLDSADFLQLCEDTEKAWRRIGLGM
ncbi:hypothetical protein G7Y89_g877 [Cudoniella acicularis]|uniref:Uncharacterized protein n=1 Tax=Cudoniella acicularis TaxID=354080 RepID=A0A8H4RY01_9HELO|nr:hypothetical protein G7Y89_g877 [Cudoniella acicularis]